MINISEEWKHVILTLPDNYFFELMKNYLGRIQTPFNKHELVDKLATFLVASKADEKILPNLDETEVLLLTSIEFISKPTAKSIYSFFSGEIPFIELCDTLKTLEEKLIIYSDNNIIFLSPLFSRSVREDIVNPGLLYRSEKLEPIQGQMLWLTDGLLLSFLSFLLHQKDIIKSSGTFKKKTFNQIEVLYPHMFSADDGEKKMDFIRRILHNLKLVRIEGSSLIPREDMWNEMIQLDKKSCWLYMVGAATTERNSNLGDRVSTIKRIIDTLPKDRSFYPDNLKKLIMAVSCDPSLNDNTSVTELIEDLIVLKVLINLDNGTLTLNPVLDLENLNPDYGDKKTVILQPNFDVTYKPWITLKDGFLIAIFCNLKKMDIYTEFALTKEAFIKGLTLFKLEEFTETLVRVTGTSVPENIILTLKEWERESLRAVHYEASVLILNKDKEFILKETGAIDHLIMLNPAKGIYLIKPEDYKQACDLLESVDIIPVDKNHKTPTERTRLPEYTSLNPLQIDWEVKIKDSTKSIKPDLESFIRGMSASNDEKEDLRKRVERGIIFTKEQIKSGISKTDFIEAKGINYQAKVRLIEVSLKSSNDRLEINYVNDLKIEKVIIFPTKVEKIDDKKILHGRKLPEETDFSIDIGKISLVKRIQTTLF